VSKFIVEVGDKVAYSVQFLRSIGCQTGDIPRARGVVKEVVKFGDNQLATIEWDLPYIPPKVVAFNLAKVGANSRFCQCD
jgi:hypothetical protein